MNHMQNPGAGFRKHDTAFLAAESVARRFDGLPKDISPGRVLAAFKRASRALRTPRSVLLLIDQLFARTQAQDWAEGCTPLVWPRNEVLADELDISIRQLQNILRRAIALGFISMKDSGNGHRGGRRGPNGAIQWAYGIDLRPLGVRYGEFLQLAEAADIERRRREELRRRLTIARKAIAQLAQTGLELGVRGADWLGEVDLAREVAAEARSTTELTALLAVVERLEARRETLLTTFRAATYAEASTPSFAASFSVDNSSADAAGFTDSTTTTELQSSKEHKYPAWREEGGDLADPAGMNDDTGVTRDLHKYGVDADFITDVCRETCWELAYGETGWEPLIGLAQREAARLHVPRSAWSEAVRVMGRRGAAAAMVAIAHKSESGLVERPGAYLRGMTAKASIGELQLGRTFHGIREAGLAPEGSPSLPRANRNAGEIVRRTAAAWRTGRAFR